MKKSLIKELMTKNVIQISEDSPLSEAIKLITTSRLHNLIVKNKDDTHSVLSINDILESHYKKPKGILISSIERRRLHTVEESTSTLEASILFKEGHDILGVIDNAQNLIGILSQTDIMKSTHLDSDEFSELSNISLSSIATRNSAFTIDIKEHLQSRLKALKESLTDCIIILKDNKPCGIITKRDVIRFLADNIDLDVQAQTLMTSPIFALEENINIYSALHVMQEKHYRRVIVLDNKKNLLGVITQKAILGIIYTYLINKECITKEKLSHLLEEQIKERTKDLEAYRETLEKTVEERTLELKEVNASLHKEILEKSASEERNAYLAKIVEDSFNEIYIFDEESLKFLEVNNSARKNLGYTSNELKRMTPLDVKKEYSPESFHQLLKNLNTQKEGFIFCTKHYRKDGSHYPIEVHLQKSNYNNQPAYVAIIIDITDRIAHEDELKQLNTLLQEKYTDELNKSKKRDAIMFHQARQASMGELLGMVAHQWRQPLTAISYIYSKLKVSLVKDNLNNEKLESKLDDINKHVQYMSQTIDDFRNFYMPDKSSQYFQLKSAMQEALQILQLALSNHNITVQESYEDLPDIRSYKNELVQVFLNVLKNATDTLIEHATNSPTISISIKKTQENKQEVRIKDNNNGIEDSIVHRIFEPYFSTKDKKNGTGLGLYMSKTIVEEHCKGNIELNNSTDGAEFIITIPSV